MAHGGEKTRLGQVGRFGIFLGAHQAGGAPLDHFLQLVAFVLQGQAVGFTAVNVVEDGPTHVIQRVRHCVDFILERATALVQCQRFMPLPGRNPAGKLGHYLQVPGDQAIEQPRQGDRQATEEHSHPQQVGQARGEQAPINRAQVDADFQRAQRPYITLGRCVAQIKVFDTQGPGRYGDALLQLEIAAVQAHPRHIGEVHQTAHLHAQLLLVEVPEAAVQAFQVAVADQLQARLDVAHFPAIFDVQLHRAGQHRKAQAEQQDEQQQAPQQPARPGIHRASAGRLIMSR
ncbi:hypothetical protein D9M71_365030 [compost metagenome]